MPRAGARLGALALVRWAVERVAGQTEQRQEGSELARAIRLIRDRLAKPNHIREVPTPWHYKVRVFRGLEASAKLALQALIATGEVVEDGKRLALAGSL